MSREGFKLENSIKNESINNKEKIIDFKMKKIVDDITRVFEEEKPEKISPRWMTKKLRYDYETLKKILPRENNKINYKPLVDLLPKHIEERWNIQEHRSNISLKDIVDDIVIVFEEEKPEKISPSWIAQKLRYDYYTLKKILPIENNKINYHLLVDLLPKHIAERWNIQEERISISLKDIVDDIVFIFEKEKPKKISLNWIAQKLRYDYETLKKILPRENNKINYQPLLDLLPKDILEKRDNQEQIVNI